jgi:hypothetical protein
LATQKIGSQLTLKFSGTAIGAFVLAGPDAGVVEAQVDGGPWHALDLYHHYSQSLHYPRTVMFATDLAPGAHTLTLRMSQRTSNGGHAMRIVQFAAN